jgi:hypothetical protein
MRDSWKEIAYSEIHGSKTSLIISRDQQNVFGIAWPQQNAFKHSNGSTKRV